MLNQNLLVIDDSQDIHGLVQVWLLEEAVELHSAFDGKSGLAMARALRPDLVLLDVDMPGTDGFEVCAQLKQDPLTRDIPIIFLTGASDSDAKLRGLEMGAVDYVVKPVEAAELRARVRTSLHTKRLLDLLEQKAVNLQESEERFRVLAENSSDIISRHRADGQYLYVSPAAESVLGYKPEQLLGRALSEFIHPDQAAMVASWQDKPDNLAAGSAPVALKFLRRDGQYIWLEFTFRLVSDGQGGVREFHGSARDITQRMRDRAIEEDRGRALEMVAQNRTLGDVMGHLVHAAERLYPDAAASCVVLFDGTLRHVAGKLPPDLRRGIDARLYTFTARFCNDATLRGDVVTGDIETDPVWAAVRPAALAKGLRSCAASLIRSGADDVLGMFCLYLPTRSAPDESVGPFLRMASRLITVAVEHNQLTEQLAHRAQHDALTGLPNRVLFEDRLQQAMTSAALNGKTIAIAFLDVDRFKNINDTLGHHAGDVMLCRLVARVSESLKESDTLARMGGDEFAMILPCLGDQGATERFGDQVISAFKEPLEVLGQELFVTISVGMAIFPKDGRDSITLKKNADAALYAAKNGGRDRVRCFTAEMNHGTRERLELENALRRAVEHQELRLHYQPQVDANDRVVGLEALLRWQHPTLGLLSPARFISLAEETGLIIPIGNWVLDEAARQLRAWSQAGLTAVPIAVNVSAMQFAQPDFEQILSGVLERHAVPPRGLELEITESLLMQNIHDASRKLERLKQIGVTIAIDDFGTGYSSLVYLQRLPIDVLKVDRTFVAVIGSAPAACGDRDNATIVRSIAALAQNLRLGMVAEGVETEEQREMLLSVGCPVMQGFLFSKPIPPEDAARLLRTAHIKRRPALALAS